MTVVHISWPELLNNPIVTTQHANDCNRIATATESLKQATHQFAQVHSERARLLANSVQFDTALRDAAAIIAMLPYSGLEYLCTGRVYCQQGRYAAAVTMYDQGLKTVPKSNVYYQQLQQHRTAAIANNSKRVDFISRLPLDIVITNIIPRLQCDKRYCNMSSDYLYVSRAWQERFLQQPNGLHYHFSKKNTSKMGHAQLVRFAPNIQSLSVSTGDVHLDDLFSRAHFSNLKVLDIRCRDSTSGDSIIKGLQMIAASLTHLEISNGSCLELRDIFESCPNLVSLETDDVNAVMPLSTRYPKMVHLSIHKIARTPLDYEVVADLLSRFPSLVSFDITPMPDSRLLIILYGHCPYLQRLHFGGRSHYTENTEVLPGRKGVMLARLHGYRHFYMQDHVIQFLLTYRNSLEMLECDGEYIEHEDSLWNITDDGRLLQQQQNADDIPENDQTQSFARLANVLFSDGCSLHCGPLIAWIVRNAPNLKSINLLEHLLQPAVADVLIKSKHLSKLQINRLSEDGYNFDGDFEGIFQFFQHHISMGDQSTLQEFTLRAGMTLSIKLEWLRLIPRLKSLKKLEISAHDILRDCIPLFAAIGQGCSALEKLTVASYNAKLDDAFVKPLRQLPNLKCLQIRAKSLSDNSVVALTTFPSLEQPSLECKVPDNSIKMLLEHIPKVIIK